MMSNFNNNLDLLKHTVCNICNKIGFNIQLKEVQGELICKQYRRKKSLYSEQVTLYEAKNNMDPYLIPLHLPLLTSTEELLIACTYMLMQYH